MNTPADMLAAALAYINLGWAVFPVNYILPEGGCSCRRPDCAADNHGKHPVSALAPNGLKNASRNPNAARDWWGRLPWNIGVATGEASGFVALDVDPRHDGTTSLGDLLARHGDFRATLTQRTGSGGFHFLFRHPGFYVKNQSGQIAPGIDVRGDGGYIIVPPSNHFTGGVYGWENEGAPMLPMPHWLSAPETTRAVQASGPSTVGDTIPHGTQHRTLVSIAGTLRRRGLNAEEIDACLQAVNLRCEQPGPPSNIRRIAESMMQYAPADAVDVGAPEIEAADGEEDGLERLGDIVAREYEALCDLVKNGGGMQGLSTGLRGLDLATGGLTGSEMVVIAARPSHGKSALGFGMALHLAKQNIPVAGFSLEMSKRALSRRYIAGETGIDSMRFRLGTITESDLPSIVRGVGSLYNLPLYLDDKARTTIEGMRRKLLGMELRPRAMFVDYLQLVKGEMKGRKFNREDEEIAAVSVGLKGIAKEFDIPVVVLVQLNRDLEKRPGDKKRPELSDLRGSGQIEQDLDVCLMLWQPSRYEIHQLTIGAQTVDMEGKAELLIRKQREGPLDSFVLRFNGPLARFEEDGLSAALGAPF